jgi:Protein of unknown function (DUF4254)
MLTASQFSAIRLHTIQDDYTALWHQAAPAVPSSLAGLERATVEQHLTNFELWHVEDSARAPEATDQDLARIKRCIDRTNQRRNDLTEQCDLILQDYLVQQRLLAPDAELHSESPGLMIDRLSILALKLFHTREEMDRADAPPGHRERNRERLLILEEQRNDLAASLDRLWHRLLRGERRFKVYRQLKMYNDPALNPAVYSRQPQSRS